MKIKMLQDEKTTWVFIPTNHKDSLVAASRYLGKVGETMMREDIKAGSEHMELSASYHNDDFKRTIRSVAADHGWEIEEE